MRKESGASPLTNQQLWQQIGAVKAWDSGCARNFVNVKDFPPALDVARMDGRQYSVAADSAQQLNLATTLSKGKH